MIAFVSLLPGFRCTFLTQKERDVETGLDYFGARYYASMQGRFTGVDPYDINLEREDDVPIKAINYFPADSFFLSPC